jgi:putative FmdB family regulatory protein
MPTYEYQCEKCKKAFDCYQSMKDAVLTVCPKESCRQKTWGKGRVKRQIGTGAGLIFKGSGFYITDYRSEGYKTAAKSDSAAKNESSGGESKASGGENKASGSESKASGSENKASGGESKAGDAKKSESKPAATAADKPKSTAKKKND